MLNKEILLMNTGDLPPEEGYEKYYLTIGTGSYSSSSGSWRFWGYDMKRGGTLQPSTWHGSTIEYIKIAEGYRKEFSAYPRGSIYFQGKKYYDTNDSSLLNDLKNKWSNLVGKTVEIWVKMV